MSARSEDSTCSSDAGICDTASTPEPTQMSEQNLAVFHRHDLRTKYLEPYRTYRPYSTATRNGTVRHSADVPIDCKPRICQHTGLHARLQELEQKGNLRQVALMLSELDVYLAAYPGSMQRPDFLCTEDDIGEVVFVEVDRTPAEIIDIEKYVVECMVIKVVKTEAEPCPITVKKEL